MTRILAILEGPESLPPVCASPRDLAWQYHHANRIFLLLGHCAESSFLLYVLVCSCTTIHPTLLRQCHCFYMGPYMTS
jgi:hypothetical protein